MELQLEKIEKSYKDKKVLKGISVTMGTGVYGLLEPNGAGKTTMICIMADVLRPDKGQILYNGRDIHDVGDEYYLEDTNRCLYAFMKVSQYEKTVGKREG